MLKIDRPTLLVNKEICIANIERMVKKADKHGVKLRPHFKTHQSKQIGQWYREAGIKGVTVSSLGMAHYFAEDGWDSITVAFPCNIREIDMINELASKINLRVLISNSEVLNSLINGLTSKVDVYIEIDEGGGRTGFEVEDIDAINKVMNKINEVDLLNLYGIYCHAGKTYSCKGEQEVIALSNTVKERLLKLKNSLNKRNGDLKLCYGDTPSCSLMHDFSGIDEISPGNFIFYDVMQTEIGSCSIGDIGIALACPVVSINERKGELCIYGGAVHLSKDNTALSRFGKVAKMMGSTWEIIEGASVDRISQEHGMVRLKTDDLESLEIGDILFVLPIHSCLTAECSGRYHLSDGSTLDHYSQKKRALARF